MKQLLHNKIFVSGVSLVVIVSVVLGALYAGDMYALQHLSFQRVTPTALAAAMRQDHFYASYRENTLLISGTVTSLHAQNGDTVVGLKTNDTYGASCDVTDSTDLSVGSTAHFAAQAYQAQRQPAGVLLRGCVIIP
ncbi:MAG TPA: hypothetical protein VKQ34_03280 [Candidatus Saccharimonadales bacterium]|nr:hypothetical protein [Candidatus Saccharimonadales bacterium]